MKTLFQEATHLTMSIFNEGLNMNDSTRVFYHVIDSSKMK